MTRLTDTQLVILNAAAQRDDRNVLPLPGSLKQCAIAMSALKRLQDEGFSHASLELTS